jgi:hypothetical protein
MTEQFVEIVDRDGRRRRARRGECLADGERFSMPMQFMDAVMHDELIAKYRKDDVIRVVDTAGAPAGHRPGFLYNPRSAHADSPGDGAYRKRVQRLEDMAQSRRVDLPVNGGNDHHHQQTDSRQLSLDALQAQAESAYRERCARMQEAWRAR